MKRKKQNLLIFFIVLLIFTCKESGQSKPGEPITPQAVYTKDNPGNWAGKENEHLPRVEILTNSGKDNIRVTVALQDSSPAHFIEKIFIADSKGRPYEEKTFNRDHAKIYTAFFSMPNSQFNQEEYAVYARCSQHDLWSVPLRASTK